MAFRGHVSIAALAAAAGIALATTGASAADLGGNCCADLEERIAELEATTARKGNRKVSLQVYGQITEAVIWWNDGAEANTYVLENYLNKNSLGVQGNAKINSDWSAGYQVELGIRAYRSSSANQLALGASNNVQIPTYNTQAIVLRQANWWIQSNTYGRITVGRTNDAVNGTSSVNLANPDGFSGIT
jgi:tetrahydrodipicolinate N-succinyltransferase